MGGDFENLQSASIRLGIITPIVLLIIFILLHTSLGSMRLAWLIFIAVPVAASGGVFALALRDMPFSIRRALDSSPCLEWQCERLGMGQCRRELARDGDATARGGSRNSHGSLAASVDDRPRG